MADTNAILTVSPFSSSIIKLDDTNFSIWKEQIIPVMKDHRLMKFLQFSSFEEYLNNQSSESSQSEVRSRSSSSQNQSSEDWEIQDQFLVGWLRGTIAKEVIGHFIGKDTTCELWSAIITRYAAASPSRVLHYRRLLQNTKKYGLSIDDYLLKMKDLAGKLTAAGDTVSERDLIMYILGGLGSDFKPISTILEVRPEQYNLDEVQYHLLSFGAKLDEENTAINFEMSQKAAHLATNATANSSTTGIHSNSSISDSVFIGEKRNSSHMSSGSCACGLNNYSVCSENGNNAYSGDYNSCTNSQIFQAVQQVLGRNSTGFGRGRGRAYFGRDFGRSSRPTCQLCGMYGQVVSNCFHRFDANYLGRDGHTLMRDSNRPVFNFNLNFKPPSQQFYRPQHSTNFPPPTAQFQTVDHNASAGHNTSDGTSTSHFSPTSVNSYKSYNSTAPSQGHLATIHRQPSIEFSVVAMSEKFAGACQIASPHTLEDQSWFRESGATVADGDALLQQIDHKDLFGTSWQPAKSSILGSTFSSKSPSPGFSFGASTASGATTNNSPMVFGASTGSAATTNSAPALFGRPFVSAFLFGSSAPANDDQMNMEDSMAEDTVASMPSLPVFGQQRVLPSSSPSPSPSPSGFVFGSAGPSASNLFQFGSQLNVAAPQNPSPFPVSSSIGLLPEGSNFSMGSGGGGVDKSNRKYYKVKGKPRKK